MELFEVRSAGLKVAISAYNHRAAIYTALSTTEYDGALGSLISSTNVKDPEDEIYMSTEAVLRNLGLWQED